MNSSSITPPQPNSLSIEATPELLQRINDTLRSKFWKWVFRDPAKTPSTLFEHLSEALPHISNHEWSMRADFGGIYVNGYPALSDTSLPCPCMVEYYEPKFSIAEAESLFPQFLPEYILHHDGDLAIVYKPPLLPSVPAKEQRYYSVRGAVAGILKRKVHMPSRLDVSVSGIVVMSTSERMHAHLQKAYEFRNVSKYYRLFTGNAPSQDNWEINAPIDKDPRHAVLRRVVADGGQSALTRFSRIREVHGEGFEVQAEPVTGRTHQIRVHAAHSGIPIDGDNFYEGRDRPHLHLTSFRVAFSHPLTGEKIDYSLPKNLRPDWISE